MGSAERIDETDARILELLQRDGRESYAEVGQAVGMSGPSAHERVKKLEARGVIRGYSALVDPTLLGYGVLAFIFIKQVPGTISTDLTGNFAEIDEIEECHHIAGESDYLLKVRATDTRHLERVCTRSRPCLTSSRPKPRSSSPARSSAGRSAWAAKSIRTQLATPAIRARERGQASGR
jgi:Transcriptional regulators